MRKKFMAAVVLMVLVAGLLQIGGVLAENGFVIHKIDDNGDPVKGAVFDVYGKPTVSWSQVTPPEPDDPVDPLPCEHDPPVKKSVKAVDGSSLPDSVGPFSFTMMATDPSYPMVPGSENGEKTLTISAKAPYQEGKESVESYHEETLLLSVEFGTITFTKAGIYDYTISENPQEDSNYTYDSNVYTVRYQVTDNNGQLEAARTFLKNGEPVSSLESIVFENTYTEPKPPETISVAGAKTWDDADNQDGKRPETITVRLHADGTEVSKTEVKADAEGKWTYEFTDLPKYREGHEGKVGEEIVYTITEDGVEDYTHVIEGFNVINTYKPGKISIDVEKVWKDNNNQDGIRPNNVTVKLLADGADTGKTVQLNAADKWEGTFDDLDEKKAGKDIVYTVEEVKEGAISGTDGPGTYAIEISGDANQGFTITNTHTPEKTSVTGTKTWNDGDNQDGKRPESITIRLHADGSEVAHKTVKASDDWKWEFKDIPKYAEGRKDPINYTITEDAVKDYTQHIHGYNITNEYKPRETTVEVEKVWEDKDNQDGKRPESVTVKLYADGTDYGKEIVLEAASNWEGEFEGLPEYAGGKEIDYTVAEFDGGIDGTDPKDLRDGEKTSYGYEVSIKGSHATGYTITNSYTPETTSISGTKTWNDNNDQDGKRPEHITVHLLADGEEYTKKEVKASDDWKWSFEDLPKYKNGKAIVYTVAENANEDYTAVYDVTPEGFNITNNYTPGKTTVAVSKHWEDNNDQDGERRSEIEVALLADGTDTGKRKTLLVENPMAVFDDLDEYKDGEKITYTVAEADGENLLGNGEKTSYDYVVNISGDATNGYRITNTYTPKTTTVTVTKHWDDANNQDGIRPESVTVNLLADGDKVDSKEISASDEWKYSFSELPVYKNGSEIVYTVTEEAIEGYEAEVDGFNITNTHTPETTTISGTKTWPDGETVKMGWTVPDNITVILEKKVGGSWPGDEVASKTISKDAATGKWNYDFGQQPKYANGEEIEYRVVEAPVAGYKASGGTKAESYNLTNEYDERTITLTKTWAGDSAAPANTRPDANMFAISLQIYKDDKLWNMDAPTAKIVDNGDNTYTVTYVVPRTNEQGNEIEYKIEEIDIPNYKEGEVTGTMDEGFAVTNTYDKRTITLTKTWAGDDLYSGHRLTREAFKQYVELLRDGTPMSDVMPTVEQGTASYIYVLTYTVPRFKADGTEYEYTIREKTIPYYKNGTVTGNMTDGFAVTNELDTVHFVVHKIWVDEENGDKRNPDNKDWQQALAEMFTLNNEEENRPGANEHYSISGATLDAYDPNTDHEITITFNDLPRYRADSEGKPVPINWTITETAPAGYTETHTEITKNDNGDFEITYTNTYNASRNVTIHGEKTWVFGANPPFGFTTPEKIHVTLMAKDNDSGRWSQAIPVTGNNPLEVSINSDGWDIYGDWTSLEISEGQWTWTVPEKDSKGRTIEYMVVEDAVPHFKSTAGTATDNYNITNTYDDSLFNISFVAQYDVQDGDGAWSDYISGNQDVVVKNESEEQVATFSFNGKTGGRTSGAVNLTPGHYTVEVAPLSADDLAVPEGNVEREFTYQGFTSGGFTVYAAGYCMVDETNNYEETTASINTSTNEKRVNAQTMQDNWGEYILIGNHEGNEIDLMFSIGNIIETEM